MGSARRRFTDEYKVGAVTVSVFSKMLQRPPSQRRGHRRDRAALLATGIDIVVMALLPTPHYRP